MDVHISVGEESRWGRIVAGKPSEMVIRSKTDPAISMTAQRTQLEWQPAEHLAGGRSRAPRWSFECIQGPDGVRRFGAGDTVAFVLGASVGGHAILNEVRRLSPEQNFSYHAMRLIWQKAPHLREYLCRSFRREQDLYLTAPERVTQDARDVLPDQLGVTSDPRSRKWSVETLMDEGRTAAVRAGRNSPTQEECIRRGVLEAARLNPVDVQALDEKETLGLLRIGLFDFGPAEVLPDDATTERVIDRLLAAVERHVDDSCHDFQRWFFEKTSDLLRVIEKQKRADGGPIPRDMVRQVILETVFRSYRYVGDCVHLQMQAVADAVAPPLSEQERALFEAVYCEQPFLRGLPLVLLAGQFGLLREIILEIFAEPTDQVRWGVLLRVLEFHAEMVRKKRESERHYKAQRTGKREAKVRTPAGGPALPFGEAVVDDESVYDQLEEVAADVRKRRAPQCGCPAGPGWHVSVSLEHSDRRTLAFVDRCPDCGHSELVRVPQADVRQILARLRG